MMSKKLWLLYALWPLMIIPFSPAVGVGLLAIWWCVQPVLFLVVMLIAFSGGGEDPNIALFAAEREGLAERLNRTAEYPLN